MRYSSSRGALIKSNGITIAVDNAKEELDLACSIRGEGRVVGWPELRLATPKQSAKMRRIVGKPPTPRNLECRRSLNRGFLNAKDENVDRVPIVPDTPRSRR